MVGWFERIALKHVYYHMRNRSPVQGRCMRQGAQGRSAGMTLRDGMGREVGSGWGTCVHLWLIHVNVWQKPPQYGKVISLQLKKKKTSSLPYMYHSAVPTVQHMWQISLPFPISHWRKQRKWPRVSPMPCSPVSSLTCTLHLQGLSLSETLGVGWREIAGFSWFSPPGDNWHFERD